MIIFLIHNLLSDQETKMMKSFRVSIPEGMKTALSGTKRAKFERILHDETSES